MNNSRKKQKLRVESGVISIFSFLGDAWKPPTWYDRGLWKKELPTERLETHMIMIE
jgi:hypothetical protein